MPLNLTAVRFMTELQIWLFSTRWPFVGLVVVLEHTGYSVHGIILKQAEVLISQILQLMKGAPPDHTLVTRVVTLRARLASNISKHGARICHSQDAFG